jgi:hypothetical protein
MWKVCIISYFFRVKISHYNVHLLNCLVMYFIPLYWVLKCKIWEGVIYCSFPSRGLTTFRWLQVRFLVQFNNKCFPHSLTPCFNHPLPNTLHSSTTCSTIKKSHTPLYLWVPCDPPPSELRCFSHTLLTSVLPSCGTFFSLWNIN